MAMQFGPWTTFEIDISDSTTLSDEVDLGADYTHAVIIIPVVDTAQMTVRGSYLKGGTAKDLYITDPADGSENKLINSSGTGDYVWIVPIGGFQFLRMFMSAAQSVTDKTFWIRGVN